MKRSEIGQTVGSERDTDGFHSLVVGGLDTQLDVMDEGDKLIKDNLKVFSFPYIIRNIENTSITMWVSEGISQRTCMHNPQIQIRVW